LWPATFQSRTGFVKRKDSHRRIQSKPPLAHKYCGKASTFVGDLDCATRPMLGGGSKIELW
jgi:hypothetical protein